MCNKNEQMFAGVSFLAEVRKRVDPALKKPRKRLRVEATSAVAAVCNVAAAAAAK